MEDFELSNFAGGEQAVVHGFNMVAGAFSDAWFEANFPPEVLRNSAVVARIGRLGSLLKAVSDLPGAEQLMKKLRKVDAGGALAEAEAIHLLRSRLPDCEIELEPSVQAAGKPRRPDFRIRCAGDPWTYGEVSHPSPAEQHDTSLARLREVIRRVCSDLASKASLTVVLHRPLEPGEEHDLASELAAACDRDVGPAEDLPNGLGTVRVGQPGPRDDDLQRAPRDRSYSIVAVVPIGTAGASCSVLMGFADPRASSVLRHKARQLPEGSPGLLVFSTAQAPGVMTGWPSDLQPLLASRPWVSAVLLCKVGLSFDPGQPYRVDTKLIENSHAPRPLPIRLQSALM